MSYVTQKGSLLSSDSVVWNNADCLGKGASALVYLGRYKKDGSLVAVKVFHDNIRLVAGSDEVRELELLRKLKHENIITLFSIERETLSKRVVLIMQYCEGGSLYHMLDQPQYVYGFPEEQFMLVLKHVATGISHLRSLGIVHRDIKPGNIMRYITEDGRSIYKLTDFGAARELQEEENFTSLYGTEEYLHPGMYERAVLRLPTGQRFDAKVDLWSLGVTFYHVATGDLPFKPYGGRNNKQKMFEIISQKSSGDISGVQNFHQGPIIWSRHLPPTCQLPRGLQEQIVPLLAGLMETDESRVIPYETLFHHVHLITNKTTLTVFDTMACQDHKLYLDGDSTYSTIQETIASLTEVPSGNQLLLVDGQQLDEVVLPTDAVSTYPVDLLQDVLFLFSVDSTTQEHLTLHHPELPTMTEMTDDVTSDARTAHKCRSRAHLIKRYTTHTVYIQELLVRAENNLRQYVKMRLGRVEERLHLVDRLMAEFRKRSESFYCMLGMIRTLLTACNCPLSSINQLNGDRSLLVVHKKAEERVEDIKSYKNALSDRLGTDARAVKKWSARCKDTDCLSTVDHHLAVIGSISSRFKRDVTVRDQMSQHDLTIHRYERQKLETESVAISSVLQDHCNKNLDIVHSEARQYYGERLKNLFRVSKVEKNVESVVECQEKLSSQLDKTGVRCTQAYQKAQEWILNRQNNKAANGRVNNIGNTPSTGKDTDCNGDHVGKAQSSHSRTGQRFTAVRQELVQISTCSTGQGLTACGQTSRSGEGTKSGTSTSGQGLTARGQTQNGISTSGQELTALGQTHSGTSTSGQVFCRESGGWATDDRDLDGHTASSSYSSNGQSIQSELSNELHSLMVESKEIASLVEENTQTIKLLEEHALCSAGSISRKVIKDT